MLLKRIRDGFQDKTRHGGGRKTKELTTKVKEKLKKMFDGKIGVSINHAARKLKVGWHTIKKWLEVLKIKRRIRRIVPKSSEKQKKKQQVILHKIARKEFKASNDDIDIIMDDETYVTMNGHPFGNNKYYYDSGTKTVDENTKFIEHEKYPKKLLLWLAISKKGRSQLYIRHQKEGAINGQVYRDECIRKRLLPFIKKHYANNNYIFWPDLASSHYSKSVMELLQEKEIKILPKERNPPNVPQLRPIETFWSQLKKQIFKEGFSPKTLSELEDRVKKCLRTFDKFHFERLMSRVGQKVRAAAECGPLSIIK